MLIIRGRLKPVGTTYEFISIKSRIKHMILKNDNENFDFVVDDNGRKSIKSFGPDNLNTDLIGMEVPIIDDDLVAKFNSDGSIEIIQKLEEALPGQHNIDQLNRVRKISKGIDIGDRIMNMDKGSNLKYMRNPIDSGIESYEDFEKRNKDFIPGRNFKNLISPFKHRSRKKSTK